MSFETNSISMTVFVLWAMNLLFYGVLYFRQGRFLAQLPLDCPPIWQADFSKTEYQQAKKYSQDKWVFALCSKGLNLLTLFVLLFTPLLSTIETFWLYRSVAPLYHPLFVIATLYAMQALIDLPVSYVYQFYLEAKHGFNRSTVGQFMKDQMLRHGLGLPLLLVMAFLLFRFMEIFVLSWPWLAWISFMLFQVVMVYLYPAIIAPLFNKFRPLDDGLLNQQVREIFLTAKIPLKGIEIMDASKRTSHGNAYFTGLGQNKKIVLFDTLCEQLSDKELRAVIAHEVGHLKRLHIPKQFILSGIMTFLMFWFLWMLQNSPQVFTSLGHLPLWTTTVILSLLLYSLLGWPLHFLSTALSRRFEYEADQYAASLTPAEDLVRALKKLYQKNKGLPESDHWWSKFFYSHPTLYERSQALLEPKQAN
jgi:STE24 endopeptidase